MSLDIFEKFLEERCLKVPRQRRLVYEEILAMDEHFDVYCMIDLIKQKRG